MLMRSRKSIDRTRAVGGRKTRWQEQDCRDQGTGFASRDSPFLPHRRGLLSFDASSGSVRRFGRRERSPGTRGEDFIRENTNLFGGRGEDLYVFAKSKRLGEKHDAFQVTDSGISRIFDSNDTLASKYSCCGHGSEANHG